VTNKGNLAYLILETSLIKRNYSQVNEINMVHKYQLLGGKNFHYRNSNELNCKKQSTERQSQPFLK